ncbi:unnamed protein product, partial [Meganyctiphanes norvegica]
TIKMLVRLILYTCNLGAVLLREHLCIMLVFLTALLASRYYLRLMKRHLPPGPWGYPLMGYLPMLDAKMHVTLTNLARQFGSIYRLRFGPKMCVVLSDPKVIKEAFRREEFAYRPVSPLYQLLQGYGIVVAIKKESQTGPCIGSKYVCTEVEVLLQALASSKSQPMELDDHLSVATHNVISMMLMSVRYGHDHPTLIKFKELHDSGFRLWCSSNTVNYFHVLRHLPGYNSVLGKLKCNLSETHNMMRNIIGERRKVFDANVTRDVLDGYLLKEHQIKEDLISRFGNADSFNKAEYEHQIIQVLSDMFSAGEETVNNTLKWSLIFLLHHPKVVSKIQEELDAVVGRQRLPNMDDMSDLPYVEATICEVLRRSSLVPLGTVHATSRNTKLNGFDIPEGTEVIPLLYACHMDPTLWKEPEQFEPSRFLDENGAVSKPDYFFPFGVGRRICLGQVMAKAELFLIFTSILHVFNIGNPADTELPSLEGNLGATLTPSNFKICFIPRQVEKIGSFKMFPAEFRTAGL